MTLTLFSAHPPYKNPAADDNNYDVRVRTGIVHRGKEIQT